MLRILLPALLAVVLLSCAHPGPVCPPALEAERGAQWFGGPFQIFGEVNPCTDGDVATVLNGPNSAQPGTAWQDGNGVRWSMATGLVNQGGDPITYIGYYRFLPEWPQSEEDLAPARPCGWPGHNRFPRVTACYFPDWQFVEVAIVFQWRDTEEDDWDILVEWLRFDPADFLSGEPADPFMPPSFRRFNVEGDDVQPDIAYDPETGELFIVYTHYVDPNHRHVMYRVGRRAPDGSILWCYPCLAQNVSPEKCHNGFHARIDIGRVTIPPYSGEQLVGIAYTGDSPGEGPRLWVNYWAADEWGDHWEYDTKLEDPAYPGNPAGVPSIDIGPPGTDFAAVAFNQGLGESWVFTTVTFIDTRSATFTDLREAFEDPQPYVAYASLAIHDSNGYPYRASVSFLAWDGQPNHYWYPFAQWVNVGAQNEVTQGGTVLISDSVYGDWNPGFIMDFYHGMNTALVIYPNNAYWMLWSSLFEGPGPDHVHGSFGYID